VAAGGYHSPENLNVRIWILVDEVELGDRKLHSPLYDEMVIESENDACHDWEDEKVGFD
jgi:hypothetical protein